MARSVFLVLLHATIVATEVRAQSPSYNSSNNSSNNPTLVIGGSIQPPQLRQSSKEYISHQLDRVAPFVGQYVLKITCDVCTLRMLGYPKADEERGKCVSFIE